MILDDFESELNTKTQESRQQIKDWVTAAVFPAIDFDKGGFLWCNGTIVHYDSFLNGIVNAVERQKTIMKNLAGKYLLIKLYSIMVKLYGHHAGL